MSERSGDDWGKRIDAVRGELMALASKVRRLIDATVSVDAPPGALARATEAVAAIVHELERFVPEPRPPRYPGSTSSEPESVADSFPYDPIAGRLSPLAPPLRIVWEEPRAIGTVTFTTPYEGPPGCVHGGVIAATFDQVLNVANLMRGVAGPTRKLEVRYLAPTPLGVPLRFEGWVESVEGRDVRSLGRVLAGDRVTAEAEGRFVHMSYEKVMRLLDASASPASSDDGTQRDDAQPADEARKPEGTADPESAAQPPSAETPAPEKPAPPSDARRPRESAAARRRRFRASGDGT
ncbi:MAG TPA: hotdog domain-containing protein [Candidatus Binatia bacterium]